MKTSTDELMPLFEVHTGQTRHPASADVPRFLNLHRRRGLDPARLANGQWCTTCAVKLAPADSPFVSLSRYLSMFDASMLLAKTAGSTP